MSKKIRILAVDDEPIIGESIAYNLEAPHREILVARNGRVALEMATKEPFDLVITDLQMPDGGGLDLVRDLRERKYDGKIVVLSGHVSPTDIVTYKELQIDEVVEKPCIMLELREIVDDLESSLQPTPTE
jgi:DNA-binding response OmpR family regulator